MRRYARQGMSARADGSPFVDPFPGCVREFLGSRPERSQRDPLNGLAIVDHSLRAIFHELTEMPERTEAALDLLRFLATYRRELLEEAGEWALRARCQRPSALSGNEQGAGEPVDDEPEVEEEPPALVDVPELSRSEILVMLLERLGPPPAEDATGASEEEARLATLASDDTFLLARRLQRGTQRTFLRLIAARMASAQAPGEIKRGHLLWPLLTRIREAAICERLGPVPGLKRHHVPRRGGWGLDAQHLWRVLGGRNIEGPTA
jgi:hypothetical protein